ncbi:MAG: nucleotide sugar dehydrogenase [Salinisphaera sp.]|jgi:UDP-N-acetyl-D-galactosamine dehydrogenase|nr:nucleotide sugar dehydrogenase [Salinisphaera sp.]
MNVEEKKVAVIGLGYVGLPLAVAFGTARQTVAFDINERRVRELRDGYDFTLEVEADTLKAADKIHFTADPADLADVDVFVVSVPTPVTQSKIPDLTPVLAATRTIGPYLRPGNIVVYESTVYPGATNETCRPLLEELSGLEYNKDFFLGYSPERANPGDKEHRLATITKVVAGSTPETGDTLCALYGEIVPAGVHRASSIEVAEAAKVIENIQRDINVALINELSKIFTRLGIDTEEVLQAAGTKWNFLPFRPGLVGGHCIGVDPYYLTYKAQMAGYHPEMILAGRRVNDGMGRYITHEVIRLMLRNKIQVNGGRALIMGFTFKENCPDLRNTRVIDIVKELIAMGMNVDIYDPWVNPEDMQHEYDVAPIDKPENGAYDAVVLAVAHRQFKEMGAKAIRALCNDSGVIYDVKYAFEADEVDDRL